MAKVLIIEDDPNVSRALRVRLTAAGLETLTAHDALQGTQLAVKHLPDVIMLDLGMAAGAGLDVLDRLGRLPSTASVPVVALTTSDDPSMREAASGMGVHCCLEKPYDPSRVLLSISQALRATTLPA